MCSVSGDPHYTTFDKQTHHYMGSCSYTLTQPCNVTSDLPYFSVHTQNEHRGSNKQVSYVRAVVVTVDGTTVILGKGRTAQVSELPVTAGSKVKPVLQLPAAYPLHVSASVLRSTGLPSFFPSLCSVGLKFT